MKQVLSNNKSVKEISAWLFLVEIRRDPSALTRVWDNFGQAILKCPVLAKEAK